MTNFFNARLCRLTTRMALIVLCLIGFLGCQSDPSISDDLSASSHHGPSEEITTFSNVSNDADEATGADESFIEDEDYSSKPDNYWDEIVTPVDGDNRDNIRSAFANKDNHKILIKEGTYPIDVLAREKGTHADHGDNLQLKNREDVLVFFEEGAKIKVAPNEFGHRDAKYMVIGIRNSKNIRIINPTIRGDKYTHLGNKKGEWAAAIKITRNSKNIQIKGADIRKMWGDGIGISQGTTNSDIWPENVLIEDFNTIDNGRNGISVTCVRDLTIRDGESSKNDRTPPEAGIDLEGPHDYAKMENIVIDNVTFKENYLSLISYDKTGSLLVNNCDIHGGFTIRRNEAQQVVKNSVFTTSATNDHAAIRFYKCNEPIKFVNNKITDLRTIVQYRRGDITLKDSKYITDKGPGSSIFLDSADDDEYLNTVVKNNSFYNAHGSTEHPSYAISLHTQGKAKILGNDVNFKKVSKYGIGIWSGANDVEMKDNTVNIEAPNKPSFKITGKVGATYDFSGNSSDISEYSTDNLKKPIKVSID